MIDSTEHKKNSSIIMTSRIRLARNVAGMRFANSASPDELTKIYDICFNALSKVRQLKNRVSVKMSEISELGRSMLIEDKLISRELPAGSPASGVCYSTDNHLSAMINEEDHLRIQCMAPGFNLSKCFEVANIIDDTMEDTIDFAFDDQFGYLTCCPTNVGTGMRASVMMHLPALTISGGINSVIDSLGQLGMTVRGIFGEGSKSAGDIYQVSNQTTLGETEENIIERFEQIITDVISKERELRTRIYTSDKYRIEDKLLRSLGELTHAVILSSSEAMNRLSDVRFAIELGIVKNIDLEKINTAMYAILPANIIKNHNLTDPADRDLKRAEIIKEILL